MNDSNPQASSRIVQQVDAECVPVDLSSAPSTNDLQLDATSDGERHSPNGQPIGNANRQIVHNGDLCHLAPTPKAFPDDKSAKKSRRNGRKSTKQRRKRVKEPDPNYKLLAECANRLIDKMPWMVLLLLLLVAILLFVAILASQIARHLFP